MCPSDVVVAPATPFGRGALAVIRLSGAGLAQVLRGFVAPRSGWSFGAGRTRRVDVFDGDGVFDDGVIVLGRGPATYTGEDTAEITLHGNPLIVERALAAAVSCGARMAAPGELTRRAVLHGKLDLVQAEAVLQVSEARTAAGLQAGRHGLGGALSSEIGAIRSILLDVCAELEARLDYPGDELATVNDESLLTTLGEVSLRCRELAGTHQVGSLWVHGARVALVGAVNAGKSSLFNALLGRTRALVHERAGTTRDVLEVQTVVQGLALTLLDTAGERDTDDPVEAAGLALAKDLIADADALIVVLRARPGGQSDTERDILLRTAGRPRVIVYNGVDGEHVSGPAGAIRTVAVEGLGVDEIVPALIDVLGVRETSEQRVVVASVRQRDRLLAMADASERASSDLHVAGVAVASEAVLEAIAEVDGLTGVDSREAVLDRLFARFCIGK